MADHNLEVWAKIKPVSPKLFFIRVFYCSDRNKIRPVALTSYSISDHCGALLDVVVSSCLSDSACPAGAEAVLDPPLPVCIELLHAHRGPRAESGCVGFFSHHCDKNNRQK